MVPSDASGLAYPVIVDFSAEDPKNQNMENWLPKVHAGSLHWDFTDTDGGKLPRCDVGKWPVSLPPSKLKRPSDLR